MIRWDTEFCKIRNIKVLVTVSLPLVEEFVHKMNWVILNGKILKYINVDEVKLLRKTKKLKVNV